MNSDIPEGEGSPLLLYPQGKDLLYVQGLERSRLPEQPNWQIDQFAQRTQTMPPFHVYQITHERLWNACRQGMDARGVIERLRQCAASPLPQAMQQYIVETMARYGALRFVPHRDGVELAGSPAVLDHVRTMPSVHQYVAKQSPSVPIVVPRSARLSVKLALEAEGYPVQEEDTPVVERPFLQIKLRANKTMRPYQAEAIHHFVDGEQHSGVIVLPCGAGKTVVGVGVMAELQTPTLILVPNEAAAAQWYAHILTWTTMDPSKVRVDDGRHPLSPITITTYQRLTAKRRSGELHQFRRYTSTLWGLIVFDEVHLLPAPLFRLAAQLQSCRRVGLSATLIREDGRAGDVFSLVGPKCFEVHTDRLVHEGYLSQVACVEVRIPLSEETLAAYEQAPLRGRHRIAADNCVKLQAVETICRQHRADQILVMGHYTDFLHEIASQLGCPMLSGATPKPQRLETYARFKDGLIPILVLSRIANVAVDLPNADVAIQVSGLFGSRQEEAQRLGRLLRPKPGGGRFYTLVSAGTVEERTARHRQRFLVEHGFAYNQITAADIFSEGKI